MAFIRAGLRILLVDRSNHVEVSGIIARIHKDARAAVEAQELLASCGSPPSRSRLRLAPPLLGASRRTRS